MKQLFLFCIMSFFLFQGCSCNTKAQASVTTEIIDTTVSMTTPTVATTAPTEETAPTEPLQIYPLNVGIEYYNYAVELPEHIYNTLGSENKLEGTIYTMDGTILSIEPMDAAGVDVEYANVQTDNGEIIILNMYNGIYQKTVSRYGYTTARKMYSDNPDYYIFPSVGEHAVFLVVYEGYSKAENKPVFQLGASADVFKIAERDDPVASALQSKLAK